jgi:hypothetical protein
MINPPSYQKDAIPTRSGWVHPQTGEILVGGSISQKNIDEYMNVPVIEVETIVEPDIVIDVEDEVDWEMEEIDLDSMTKAQLIETAEEWEVEIDPKASKSQIKELLEEELF